MRSSVPWRTSDFISAIMALLCASHRTIPRLLCDVHRSNTRIRREGVQVRELKEQQWAFKRLTFVMTAGTSDVMAGAVVTRRDLVGAAVDACDRLKTHVRPRPPGARIS